MIPKIKILIVEDETIVALELKSVIKKLGCEVVDAVTNHDDALEAVKNNEVDMIFMDINLENSKDGIETAAEIKKLRDIPVLYLTAYSDDGTIERAIRTNPVGYLNKPFRREDIKSSIMLSLHKLDKPRTPAMDGSCVDLGQGYYYDLDHDNLYYNDLPVKLSVKENLLLKILVEARGQLVPFSELEYHLWPSGAVSESSLRTLMYRLRSKLEHKLIETIPSFGCKLPPKN